MTIIRKYIRYTQFVIRLMRPIQLNFGFGVVIFFFEVLRPSRIIKGGVEDEILRPHLILM